MTQTHCWQTRGESSRFWYSPGIEWAPCHFNTLRSIWIRTLLQHSQSTSISITIECASAHFLQYFSTFEQRPKLLTYVKQCCPKCVKIHLAHVFKVLLLLQKYYHRHKSISYFMRIREEMHQFRTFTQSPQRRHMSVMVPQSTSNSTDCPAIYSGLQQT